MHIIDTKKIPLTQKGGKLWPDVDYIGWRAIQKLINQHIHIFPGKLCSAFSERPGAWFPLPSFCPVDCPGHPSVLPPPPPRSPLAKQHQSGLLLEDRSKVPGGQAGGWWGDSDVRESREARRYCGRGLVEPTQTPGYVLSFSSQPTCCPLHCLSLTTPFISTEIFLLSTAVQKFRFLCAVLVCGANVHPGVVQWSR